MLPPWVEDHPFSVVDDENLIGLHRFGVRRTRDP